MKMDKNACEAERVRRIREAERQSHIAAYASADLYDSGSWLSKPVKTVVELLPLFADYREFRGLDLGCGVGRNSIAVAKAFRRIPCQVECVDLLEEAIDGLKENAEKHEVIGQINGMIMPIEEFCIEERGYDLILAVSALEHVESKAVLENKLREIKAGLRDRGVVCLIMNTRVEERDRETGEMLPPQFEVNLPTDELQTMLKNQFADWECLKNTVVKQRYTIPRGNGEVLLTANVITGVYRRGGLV